MEANITREQALALLREYNKEPFHIQHALTVEGVLRWYARELGCGADEEFWALAGLLHDIDFERWPEEHCRKAPELLEKGGCSPELIHAVCSHGYGICCDVEPVHEMEKVLFAADELTGLIGAAAFSVCAVSLFSTKAGLTIHWPSLLLFAVMLAAMNLPKLKKLPAILFIAISAVVGVVFQMVD